jgi:hypothetical protein
MILNLRVAWAALFYLHTGSQSVYGNNDITSFVQGFLLC